MILSPRVLLRVEGLLRAVACCVLYGWLHYSWLTFALLILAPDLSMFGYLASMRIGTWSYNLAHTYTAPLILFVLLFVLDGSNYYGLVLIWIAHIAFDRALGYGLKYETAFKDTHLQRV